MCILSLAPTSAQILPPLPAPPTARTLTPPQRQQLALDALTGQPITELARQRDVSRKFVYQQADKAQHALQQAFQPPPPDDDILFYLPVTKAWIRQLVLALALLCHSSFRGIIALLRDLFDYHLSLGSVFNILHSAVPLAQRYNTQANLATVRLGLHDEIFQAAAPVLVGVDADSTYCYLLSQEEHRDADTWGVRLLELVDRGFHPQATVADGGLALRAAQDLALPGVPCHRDLFHLLQDIQPLVSLLENRAYDAMAAYTKLEQQQAHYQRRHNCFKSRSFAQKLSRARQGQAQAIALAEDVAQLLRWLRQDILPVTGPDYPTRCELWDFVVAELRAREEAAPPLLKKVRTQLQKQREGLLAFAAELDHDLTALAGDLEIPVGLARTMLQVQGLDPGSRQRWQGEQALWQQLGPHYLVVRAAVADLSKRVVRASSLVENWNSRLRTYFFLRRHLGAEYLGLLQFFLNHRRYERSECPERAGRSPAELLTGQEHAHWLEMLGYTRFCRN